MTDFETRLRESLRDRADAAPGAAGLAAGARRRVRRRRTAMATVAAAAVVAVAAPFVFVDRDPESTGIATDPTSPSATTTVDDDGLRTESWHDLTFEVPDSWGFGGTSAWCTNAGPPEAATPTVGRPTDIVPMILCDPGQGYGVMIGSSEAASLVYDSGHVWQYDTEGVDQRVYPDGAWLSYWYDDESLITVATPDRALTEQIVGSVRRIEGVDANGCAPTLGEAEAGLSDGTDSMSVCRYDAEEKLEWSWRLSQDEANRLDGAVQAAPMSGQPTSCDDQTVPVGRTVILTGGTYTATVITDSACEGANGIFLSGVVREVTDDARMAIERPSPGS